MPSPATLSAPDPREPQRRPNVVQLPNQLDPLTALRTQVAAGIADVDAALSEGGAPILACQDQDEVDRYAAALVKGRLADPAAKLAGMVQAEAAQERALADHADVLSRRRDALPVHDPDAVRERRPWDTAGRVSLGITIAVGLVACSSGGWNIATAVFGTAGYKGAWGVLPAALLGVLLGGGGMLIAELLHRSAARDQARFEARVRVIGIVLVAAMATFAVAFAIGFADRRTGNVAALLAAAARPTGSAWGMVYCLSLLAIEATIAVLAHIHLLHLLRGRYRGNLPKNPEWAHLDEQIQEIRGRIAQSAKRHADAEGLRNAIAATGERIGLEARGRWRRHRAQFGIGP